MDRLIEATALAERDHFWFRGFRRFVAPLLARAAAGRTDLRILDCGCGTGNNFALLEPHGETFGFDLTWSALEIGHASGKRRLALAGAAQVPFRDAAFDLVTAFDVFQCLSDPDERAAAAELHRVLRPGGYVLLNVAAMDALWGNHSILSHEVRRYSSARLRVVLSEAGFDVLRLSHTNALLFPLVFSVRLAQRLLGLPTSDEVPSAAIEIRMWPAPINAALTGVLAIEAALVRRFDLPFGSSIICLARKR